MGCWKIQTKILEVSLVLRVFGIELEYVFNFIDLQEQAGIYMTHDGQDSMLIGYNASTPDTNINAANLRDDGRTTIKKAVTALSARGRDW